MLDINCQTTIKFTFQPQNYNILIIEDSKSINKILYTTFTKLKYNCFQAFTLKEAKEILASNDIHYLMLDVNLPDGSGYDIIKELENTPEKIFVLTNETDKQFREVAYQKGVIDFIEKDKAFFNKIGQISSSIEQLEKNRFKTILIIDDSIVIQEQLKDIFENRYYNVEIASSTAIALDILNTKLIDLIILDVELKNENGIEFLQKNRINIVDKQKIPVMIVSGNVDSSTTRNALKAGAVDLIKKPYVIEEIVLKVDLWIDYKRKDDEIQCTQQLLNQYKDTVDRSSIVSKANPSGLITYVNDKFCEISGYTRDELLGKNHNIIRHDDMNKEIFSDLWHTIKTLKQPWVNKVKNKKKHGGAYWVDTVINPILDIEGNVVEYIGIRSDITDMINPKKTILDIISNAKAPLFMIAKIADWDILKDFYGQKIANDIEDKFEIEILKYFSKSCQFEKTYRLNNGKYGFYRDFDEYNDGLTFKVENELKIFQENVRKDIVDFGTMQLDLNVIISFALENEFLFESVELGLKKAINEKQHIVFANGIAQKSKVQAKNNIETIKMIKTAIETNNIISYFQPIINNQTQEIEKYESLVRLVKEDGSIVSPYFFIDISKRGAYYNQITNIVIDNTFEALKKTDKNISINLSALDIENVDIRNKLINLVSQKENYNRLTFELLEDEIVNDFDQIKDFLILVKTIGAVKIAIDDFGAGYSNFERLLDYQPDILKIDGSLIKNITTNKFSLNVVETIVTFAKKQNIKITAEFVENEEIFIILQNLGIEFSQGYYFGKPQPLD